MKSPYMTVAFPSHRRTLSAQSVFYLQAWMLRRTSGMYRCLALFFSFLFLTSPAAACELPAEPSRDGRSQWYCSNASPTVFVFVHGLNSNSADAWSFESESAREFWPSLVKSDKFLAAAAPDTPVPSILLASYHTSPGSGSFGIEEARQQIYDAIINSIDGQPPAIDKKTIILIGHSLGGVLLRDVLSQYSERFLGKQLGLLLVASPSKGSNFANIASYAQWAFDNKMVRELEEGSSYLDSVHQRFAAAIAPAGALRFVVGRELFEHLGMLESAARCSSNILSMSGLYCAGKQRVLSYVEGGPVVPEESAVIYWPSLSRQIPQSNHSSIAAPNDTAHPTHQALRELVEATVQAAVNPCKPPPDFSVALQIEGMEASCAAPPARAVFPLELLHLDTGDGKLLRRPLEAQYEPLLGIYRLPISEPPFPCSNEIFWAKLVEKVQTSRRMPAEPCAADLCFRRSKKNATAKFAEFKCVAGSKCIIPEASSGVAEICDASDLTPVMTAARLKPEKQDYWLSPSLETIEKINPAERSGYTEFYVLSEPLQHIAGDVSVGYAVYVNGRQVRYDGLDPFYQRQTVSKGSRLQITFPIENLGFRGGTNGDGIESIKVEIKFFHGDAAASTAVLQRGYIAYRHGAVERTVDLETGETFSWRAIYRPAGSGRNFEVMLEHGAEPQWMRDRRQALDGLAKQYAGQPVIGVLRPGRAENRRIGMILGLVQETGQVRSLFSREEAVELCRWIGKQAEFDELQKTASYIFEFPAETFDDVKDRGRRIAYCNDI